MSTNEHDDPVISEIPVYVKNSDTVSSNLLYLLQYTHLTSFQCIPSTFSTVQFKPQAQQLLFTVPFNTTSPYYSKEKAIELNHSSENENTLLTSYTLSGDVLPQSVTYYAARKEKDGIVMIPLNGVVQVGPTFHYLDEKPDLLSSSQRDSTSDMRAIQMQFRKKETAEELNARLHSYTYQLKRSNDESWQNLSVLDPIFADKSYKLIINDLISTTNHEVHHIPPNISNNEHLEVCGITKSSTNHAAVYHNLSTKTILEQIRSIIASSRIISFKRLFELVQFDNKTEHLVLEHLEMVAWLVYGDIWVIKSDLINQSAKVIHSRNLLINLFKTRMNQNPHFCIVTKQEFVDCARIHHDLANILLKEIAELVYGKGWKLKIDKIDYHSQDLITKQEKLFERELQRSLVALETFNLISRPQIKVSVKKEPLDTASTVKDDELGLSILDIVKEYHVLDFQSICHLVRKKISSSDEQILTKLRGHSCLVELPQVWTLKNVGDEQLDKYRTVILSLFGSSTTLKRSDIVQRIREQLNDDIPNNTYNKIMKGLATSSGSQWTLRTGHLEFVKD